MPRRSSIVTPDRVLSLFEPDRWYVVSDLALKIGQAPTVRWVTQDVVRQLVTNGKVIRRSLPGMGSSRRRLYAYALVGTRGLPPASLGEHQVDRMRRAATGGV